MIVQKGHSWYIGRKAENGCRDVFTIDRTKLSKQCRAKWIAIG